MSIVSAMVACPSLAWITFGLRFAAIRGEGGQGVEGGQVPGEPVFGWAERASVAVEECVSQVRSAWPGAEPEADEVAGG